MLCEVAFCQSHDMRSGLLPKRCYAKWLAAKVMRCEVADAKAVVCKMACCQSDAVRSGLLPKRCCAKRLAAEAMLCEVADAKATVCQKWRLYGKWPMPKLCEVADAKAMPCEVADAQAKATVC